MCVFSLKIRSTTQLMSLLIMKRWSAWTNSNSNILNSNASNVITLYFPFLQKSLLKIICCVFLCSCKPRIGGRQCDRCAAGYYRFPDCVPCDCNQGGVTADMCHPDTGRCLCKVSSFHQLADLKTPSHSSLFICLSLLRLSLYYCCHVCREMLLASSVIPVGKVPSILTPPTLMAVPAASASERLTCVRAPANAGGRYVCFFVPLHVYECLWKFHACKAFCLMSFI